MFLEELSLPEVLLLEFGELLELLWADELFWLPDDNGWVLVLQEVLHPPPPEELLWEVKKDSWPLFYKIAYWISFKSK